MRILHLYKDVIPVLGGIENHVHWLSTRQAATGHDVSVLACALGRTPEVRMEQGVHIELAPRIATLASMPISPSMVIRARRYNVDILHVHSPFPLGELAAFGNRTCRARVLTFHAEVVRQKNLYRLYKPIYRRLISRFDGIITTSPGRVEAVDVLTPARDKCTQIPLGIPLDQWTELQSQGDGVQLLFVGKLRHYKGVDILLRALSLIPEAHLTIVGNGPLEEELREECTRLMLNDRVFFAGEVSESDLIRHVSNTDVFVLPSISRAEAFGLAMVEAMASGIPVISTELGTGTSWVNEDGVTGLVVPAGDSETLAGAIQLLINNTEQRKAMGAAARRRATDLFSLETMSDRTVELYERLLNRLS